MFSEFSFFDEVVVLRVGSNGRVREPRSQPRSVKWLSDHCNSASVFFHCVIQRQTKSANR